MISQKDLKGRDCDSLHEFIQTFIISAWISGQTAQAKKYIRKLSDYQKLEFNNLIDDMKIEERLKWKDILINCSLDSNY